MIIKLILINTITDNHFIFVLFMLFVNNSMYIYLLHFYLKTFDITINMLQECENWNVNEICEVVAHCRGFLTSNSCISLRFDIRLYDFILLDWFDYTRFDLSIQIRYPPFISLRTYNWYWIIHFFTHVIHLTWGTCSINVEFILDILNYIGGYLFDYLLVNLQRNCLMQM